VRSFSRAELRYLTEVNGRDHVALVAEYPSSGMVLDLAA
jgi:hypothetical protein